MSPQVMIESVADAHLEEFSAAVDAMTRIELEVLASNPRATHVFESLGFEWEGFTRGARALDGRVDDLIGMARMAEGR